MFFTNVFIIITRIAYAHINIVTDSHIYYSQVLAVADDDDGVYIIYTSMGTKEIYFVNLCVDCWIVVLKQFFYYVRMKGIAYWTL